MNFGTVPVEEASGGVLAHSLRVGDLVLRKGRELTCDDVESLRNAGVAQVVVARLGEGDVTEDDAAQAIADRCAGDHLRLGPVATGRTNVISDVAGVLRVDAARVHALNAVDEGVTLATLADYMRVDADQLVATVKIIPYGVSRATVEKAVGELADAPFRLHPFKGGTARLILTRTPGFKESLLDKAREVVAERMKALGYDMTHIETVPHEESAIASALVGDADIVLILGASATSDRNDVAPAAVVAAGGRIERFGMPVDPGNLLFLGHLNGTPVVGLPGCARSPALNGVDWVLERLSARLDVTGEGIARMGVGGLLKEMPDRPHPRRGRQSR